VAIAHALLSYIERRDVRVMRRVNRWRAPRWVRIASVWSTRLGDGWLWYSMAPLILLIGGDQRYRALATASFAALAGIVLFKCVKHACRRQRPCENEPHCWANILPPDQFSFPSGHTITAFAIAVSLGHPYSHAEPCLFLMAACIGVSRVMLGMHFVSDVLAGALFGAAVGFGSFYLFALL
jgi:undecaprenyl-diphosphatase